MNQRPSAPPESQVPGVDSLALCMIFYFKLGSRRIHDPLEDMPIYIYGTPYYGNRKPEYSAPEAKWVVLSKRNADDPNSPVETLWESATFTDPTPYPEGVPEETAELRAFIDRLVQTIVGAGWQPYGQGQHWFEFRFCRPNQ